MKYLAFYDDTVSKNDDIREVIGQKGFGDVVVKKKRLESYYEDAVRQALPSLVWTSMPSVYAVQETAALLDAEDDARVLHIFANFFVTDAEKLGLTFQKLAFVDARYKVLSDAKIAALFFPNVESYRRFLKKITLQFSTQEAAQTIERAMPAEGLVDLGETDNFISCITGSFDSRYFNSVRGDAITLVKTSRDKRKIKAEYTYYHLLPDDMKMYFVMPFHYEEKDETASYTMEHLHMTDLAIKWVHGSIDLHEFQQLLDKYFIFFSKRHPKEISRREYQKMADKLYVEKVHKRIAMLKDMPAFQQIAALLAASEHLTIDDVVKKYFRLKDRIEAKHSYPSVAVIGHGDPCFANTLYHKSTQMLKFIDPKGALTEAELWMNPYYDIAKLSHSVCGRYDFFNNGTFSIRIDENFRSELVLDFDNTAYIRAFRQKLEACGFDYLTVRIYEASLFLSMLPLHIDNPHKVFGFILNAIQILKEIENYAA